MLWLTSEASALPDHDLKYGFPMQSRSSHSRCSGNEISPCMVSSGGKADGAWCGTVKHLRHLQPLPYFLHGELFLFRGFRLRGTPFLSLLPVLSESEWNTVAIDIHNAQADLVLCPSPHVSLQIR